MEEVQQALAFLANLGAIVAPERLDGSDDERGGSIVATGLPDRPQEAIHQHEALQERSALVAWIHDPAPILVRQEDVVVQGQETDRCRSLGIRKWSVRHVEQLATRLITEGAQPGRSRSRMGRMAVSHDQVWTSAGVAGPNAAR